MNLANKLKENAELFARVSTAVSRSEHPAAFAHAIRAHALAVEHTNHLHRAVTCGLDTVEAAQHLLLANSTWDQCIHETLQARAVQNAAPR